LPPPAYGGGGSQGVIDGLDYRVGLRKHVGIPEAQNAKPTRSQTGVAIVVVDRLSHVLATVQLNDDRGFKANEVTDVRADRMLSSEFEAVQLASSQMMPKETFGFRGVVAQVAGVVVQR
jgi:hypothetical protein